MSRAIHLTQAFRPPVRNVALVHPANVETADFNETRRQRLPPAIGPLLDPICNDVDPGHQVQTKD